jgi:hypothetical protein
MFTHTGITCRVSSRWRFKIAITASNSPMSLPGGNRDRVNSQMSFVEVRDDLLVIIQSKTVKMISPRVGAGFTGSP